MNQIKQIISLYNEGNSYNEITKLLGKSRKTVTKYILLFKSTGIDFQELKQLSESEIFELLTSLEKPNEQRLKQLQELFEYFNKELKKVGVTKQLLWSEYKISHPDGYNLTQFCYHFNSWQKAQNPTMHFEHKAGDKMFIDFAGEKLSITDTITGVIQELEVFVAILGASQLTYVEAVRSQKKAEFIKCVENALHFYGGVPRAIVPDNLKSAVNKADKYEPEINQTFANFSLHYDTTILPARSRKPRDKALVENAVKIIYTRIYANIRNRVFFSIKELNTAIRIELEKHNNTNFQNREISRYQIFKEIEENTLKSLPNTKYEIKDYAILTLYKNSHIYLQADQKYYSAPYKYIGKKVKVEYSKSRVNIYYLHERIASHSRNYSNLKYTTQADHLPSYHQQISEWSPEKFISWAQSVGEFAEKVIREIIKSKQHPEQSYKSCLGILSYGKKIGYHRLNQACRRADQYGSYSYKAIINIITNNYDKLVPEEKSQYCLPFHENIRGAEYYRN